MNLEVANRKIDDPPMLFGVFVDVCVEVEGNSCAGRQDEIVQRFRNKKCRFPFAGLIARAIGKREARNARIRQQKSLRRGMKCHTKRVGNGRIGNEFK